MRSHVTKKALEVATETDVFQYRKRYEITCDFRLLGVLRQELEFQYRKRYEITCDKKSFMDSVASI